MQDLPLNTLDQPIVPVKLEVNPQQAHIEATFQCTDGNGLQLERVAHPKPWSFRVPVGTYTFRANFASPQFMSVALENQLVRPPYLYRVLKVKP
jgi:hypothetical protein